MTLTPGTRLGTFEIVAPLGAGGMGEVYRARDTRLDRDVAIKVLPERVAQDAERLTRFEREAKALAALNHPNIAQIYAVEGRALVMELVDGTNLAGPLPPETAARYAAQIADALEAAHEKGIVHRDLKPANVMITPAGTVKVLDFGLAAMPAASRASASDATNSPTMTIAASQAGTIMGTAGYMSPEQAAGKPVDRRADIWSFGVVFWEMLTGQALFSGETVSHTLADVLRKEIDLNALPKNTPPAVRTLLGRCLDRDVRTRLRDIGEARILLSRPLQPAAESSPAPQAVRKSHARWAWLAAAMCAAAIPAAWFLKPAPPEAPLLKFDIMPPPGAALGAANWGTMQVSPDGNNIAFVARDRDRVLKLFVRNLHSGTSVAMPGTENALAPAWSPDSSQIAFLAAGKLKRLELSGSQVIEVSEASIGSFCMWHDDGNIYVSCADHVLRSVRASGGTLSAVFPDTSQVLGASPAAIPGKQAFIYQLLPAPSKIVLASPDGSVRKTLLPSGSGTPATFATDRAGGGWLLHRKDTGQLAAIAFDPRSESVRGEERILVQNVSSGPSWSTSNNGVLAYRPQGWGGDRQLTWMDRSGTQAGTIGEPSNVFTQRISPDQKSVVFTRIDAAPLLYVHDLIRGTTTRVSAESSRNAYAEWMPDGKSVIYMVQRTALGQHATFATSGEKILQKTGSLRPTGVSPDGKWLLSASITVGVPRLVLTSLETGKNIPFGGDMSKSHHGSFSPDGRWIVYSAYINGRWDVFVRPVPAEISGKPAESEGQVQISRAGGLQPVWRRDGKEIFYVAAGGMLTAVPMEVNAMSVRPGTPAPLFQTNLGLDDNFQREYDATADGKRFLLPLEAPSGQTEVPITVVINWPKLMEKR